MKILQLIPAMILAAGSCSHASPVRATETIRSVQSLAVPEPVTISGLPPFQFPNDYNASNPYNDGVPDLWHYCSKNTSDWITVDHVDELVKGRFLESTFDNGTIPFQTGLVWYVPMGEHSTQIYVCNHSRRFSFPFSAGLFRKFDDLLDQFCGITVSGYVYLDTPWDVAIGRDTTTPEGYAKSECGGELP